MGKHPQQGEGFRTRECLCEGAAEAEEVADGLQSLEEEDLLQHLPVLFAVKEVHLCSPRLTDHVHLSPGSWNIHAIQLGER